MLKNDSKKKKIKLVNFVKQKHWVGNGFHVYGLLRISKELYRYISPFILMDYAPPKNFNISSLRRGVGEHPHRGFETVTFSYQGEIEHRDSLGGGGIIKPGDVQWMTAGNGIVHDEFHSLEFSKKGGIFEMVQLWINLPKKNKMTQPKYQGIKARNIPTALLGKGTNLRIIAGNFRGINGSFTTYTPINIYDLVSKKDEDIMINFKCGTNTIILIMKGEMKIENSVFKKNHILIFEPTGEDIAFKACKGFKCLILNGEPINEPIFTYGPFVMNTKKEIHQAILDFESGKMGSINKY